MHTPLIPNDDVLPIRALVAPSGFQLCMALHLLLKVEHEVAEWGVPTNRFGVGRSIDTAMVDSHGECTGIHG